MYCSSNDVFGQGVDKFQTQDWLIAPLDDVAIQDCLDIQLRADLFRIGRFVFVSENKRTSFTVRLGSCDKLLMSASSSRRKIFNVLIAAFVHKRHDGNRLDFYVRAQLAAIKVTAMPATTRRIRPVAATSLCCLIPVMTYSALEARV